MRRSWENRPKNDLGLDEYEQASFDDNSLWAAKVPTAFSEEEFVELEILRG